MEDTPTMFDRAIPRERLSRRLRERLPGAAVWLAAAGGYGKTTFVQNHARRHADEVIHLAVPGGGWTPGDLFHALRTALERMCPSMGRLPPRNAEWGVPPADFAAAFALAVVSRLPEGQGWLLFLDDFHHVGAADELQEVVVALTDRLAAGGVEVVVAAREEPPAPWACLRGRRRLLVLDEAELAFDAAELRALLAEFQAEATHAGLPADAPTVEALQAACGGWITGAVLLLEHYRRTGGLNTLHPADAHSCDALVQWFRREVYDALDPGDRDLLCRLALPEATPWGALAEVTGVADAPARLRQLVSRHVFLYRRRRGRVWLVAVHKLFRGFLRRELRAALGPEAYSAHAARCGQALWDAGAPGAGAELMLQAGEYRSLAERLHGRAAEMVREGRADTLRGWLESLPESVRWADAHLLAWEGWCKVGDDPAGARALLEAAWEPLVRRRAWGGMAVAWVGIIDSIWLEWAPVDEYARWLDAVEPYKQSLRTHLPPSRWRTVLRGLLVATAYARPRDPAFPGLHREALEALSADTPPNERVMLAGQLMCLNAWHFGRRAEARRILSLIGSCARDAEAVSPLVRSLWHTYSALWSLLFEADHEGCLDAAEKARWAAGGGKAAPGCAVPALHSAVAFHDRSAFDAWMEWFTRSAPDLRGREYPVLHSYFLACGAWLRERIDEAIHHLGAAADAADRHGSAVFAAGLRGLLAGLLAEAGRFPEALREAGHARRRGRGHPSELLTVMLHTALARIPLRRGRPARALPYIRRAFSAGARQGLFFPVMVRRDGLGECCALALRHGIAPEYAAWLVRQVRLPPPKDQVLRAVWPWPARLYTLGRFHLGRRDGGPGNGRARRRQREEMLLGQLVLAGRRGADPRHLAERVWPDSPPEKAYNTLCVALHRLRDQQFGDTEAVLMRGGVVFLNPERVWVDLWEFHAVAAHPEALPTEALEACVELYGGELCLPGAGFVELEMERAAAQRVFERLAVVLGRRLEAEAPHRAADHYRRAIGHCSTHPYLWVGLLRCEAAAGDPAALRRAREWMVEVYREELDADPPEWIENALSECPV